MLTLGLRMAKALLLASAILAPVAVFGQSAFTYTPMDMKTMVVTAGSVSIQVRTLVIIQGDPATPATHAATKTFTIKLRPPEDATSSLLMASIDHLVVDLTVLKSNADGEMEGTIELPIGTASVADVKLDWQTKSQGVLETTAVATISKLP